MTDLLIRKPEAHELDSIRMVVQTVVDETYGGLWASSPLPVDERGLVSRFGGYRGHVHRWNGVNP